VSSDEWKEAIRILVEIAQTGMCCLDARQERLLRQYAQIMGKHHEDAIAAISAAPRKEIAAR
jgi:hypothetical protein